MHHKVAAAAALVHVTALEKQWTDYTVIMLKNPP